MQMFRQYLGLSSNSIPIYSLLLHCDRGQCNNSNCCDDFGFFFPGLVMTVASKCGLYENRIDGSSQWVK